MRPADDSWRRHAAERLGVAPDSDAETARRAFLARLEEEDFVPPDDFRQALELVAAGDAVAPVAASAELVDAFERGLAAEVDEFIEWFFQLSVPDRRERWEKLMQECERFPLLLARLERLEPGLAVERTDLIPLQPLVRELAEHARRLFLLPAGARTLEREKLLDQMSEQRSIWPTVARQLQKKGPQFANLKPDLLKGIPAARLRSVAIAPAPVNYVNSSGGNNVPMWFAIVVISAITAFIRGIPDRPENKLRDHFSPGRTQTDGTPFPGAKPESDPDPSGKLLIEKLLREAEAKRRARAKSNAEAAREFRTKDGGIVREPESARALQKWVQSNELREAFEDALDVRKAVEESERAEEAKLTPAGPWGPLLDGPDETPAP